MAYKIYNVTQGSFAVDWDTCTQIIRSHYRSKAQLSLAYEVTESQRGINPLSWGLPDLTYLEVNWDEVKRQTEEKTLASAWELAAYAVFDKNGINKLVTMLQSMQQETRSANKDFLKWQRKVSKKSWTAMEESTSGYQKTIDQAILVRDLSGSVLIGAATVATGGATTTAAFVGGGLGTTVKTIAKYQDTGNLGVAAIEATQNIVTCIIPAARGAGLAGQEKTMKVIFSAVLDTDKAVLEGRELSTALLEGAMNIPAALAGETAKKIFPLVLDRTVVPVAAAILSKTTETTSTYLNGIAKKILEDRLKKQLQGYTKGDGHERHEITRSRSDSNSWDSVMTFSDHDELLLKFAIIDIEKGVGRSWW